MKKMTIGEIIEATNAQVIAVDGLDEVLNKTISHITQNSKEVTKDSLFFAVQGERVDGHQFIEECFEKGIAACLSSKVIAPKKGSVLLLVPDVKKALLKLAAHYRNKFNIPFIGITGSVGKTTTKDMVASVLGQKYDVLWTQGNYNNDIGVPLTLFRLEDHHEIAVIEMGMNHFGEIHALAEVVRPQLGLISNVGVAHIEYLGSREGILKAKCEMFDFMPKDGIAVLNGDNDMLHNYYTDKYKIVKIGIDSDYNFKGCRIIINKDSIEFGVKENGEDVNATIKVPVPGKHNVLNSLLAIAVARELKVTYEEIQGGIENLQATSMRLDVLNLDNYTIINDAYNASPDSMEAALEVLKEYNGRKIAVLGTMKELGEDSARAHEQVGAYAKARGIDLLFTLGEFNENFKKGYGSENFMDFNSMEELIAELKKTIKSDDILLIKASRSMKFENIIKELQKKNI